MTCFIPSFLGDFCSRFGRCVTSLFRSKREKLPIGMGSDYTEETSRVSCPKSLVCCLLESLLSQVMWEHSHVRMSPLVREQALLVPTPEYLHTRTRQRPAARFAPVWLAVLGCCNPLCWCDQTAACRLSCHLFRLASVQSSRRGGATFSLWLSLCCMLSWACGSSSPGSQMAAPWGSDLQREVFMVRCLCEQVLAIQDIY